MVSDRLEPSVTVTLIAGEASGDRLGGRLIAALRALRSDLRFSGIGGERMEAQGLSPWFPMQELSLMGFAEVLPYARRLQRRICETVERIERERPDVLVTIDSPGFNCRVVKRLRDRGRVRPRLVHYVAPTVWAYKPKRAAKTAALFDRLLTLLPFEPPYFEREGLAATFVGHPATEDAYDPAAGAAFRARHGIAPGESLLCIMPGSRRRELATLLPVFTETASRLAARDPRLRLVIPATAYSAKLLEQMRPCWPIPPIIVADEEEKRAAMLASDIALAKSGTVALEAALAGLPMVTAYKVHPLSAWLLRRMVTTRYFNLVNILENREVIPELMQEDCAAEKLTAALTALGEDEGRRTAQRTGYIRALRRLSSPVAGETPSQAAARIILAEMGAGAAEEYR